jgi:DivIVA domain-containing protein
VLPRQHFAAKIHFEHRDVRDRPAGGRTEDCAILHGMPDVGFTIVLRGYDIDEVNDLLKRANLALGSADPAARADIVRELREAAFTVRMRGYERSQVDTRLGALADQLSA